MGSTSVNAPKARATWNSRIGFILAAAGISIGVGNIWRFPYLVGQNGGGAFIVAYIAILAFVGLPIFIMELGVGKLVGKGTIEAYIAGTGSGFWGTVVGGYIAVIPLFINMTYIGILAYAIYYVYVSLTGMWFNLPPEVIYKNLVDNKLLLVSLFSILTIINGIVVYRGINKGLEAACKVMIPMVFIGMFALLLRAMFIPNIISGLEYYMTPNWSYLTKLDTWMSAGSQAAFSIGIGPSMMIVYASHLKKNADITMNSLTITFMDTAVAVLAGFAIIPATVALGLNVESGAPLIFIVLPTLFKMIPFGQLFATVFFVAVFFAGLSSSISHLETPVTSYMDHFKWSRGKSVIVFTIMTLVGGIICVYNMQFLDIISVWIGDYCYSLSALIGGVVFAWMLGIDKIREEANLYSEIKLGKWFNNVVRYIAIPVLAVIVLASFF